MKEYNMKRILSVVLATLTFIVAVSCEEYEREDSSMEPDENPSGTLMIGKLILLPILAGVGLKFLTLFPIVLSKIALLGILSFVSSNLSLLVSALMGIKSFFFEGGGHATDDHDHDHHKPHHGYDYGHGKGKGKTNDDDDDDDHYSWHEHKSHPPYDHKHHHRHHRHEQYDNGDGLKASKLVNHITEAVKSHIRVHKQRVKGGHREVHDYDHDDSVDHEAHRDQSDHGYKNDYHPSPGGYGTDHGNRDYWRKYHDSVRKDHDDDGTGNDRAQEKYIGEWKTGSHDNRYHKSPDRVTSVRTVDDPGVSFVASYNVEELTGSYPEPKESATGYKVYENDHKGPYTSYWQPQSVSFGYPAPI